MKNIFKKNQIIITALAIMIAIAGYLNFSERNHDENVVDVGTGEVLDYDTTAETMGDDVTKSDLFTLDDSLISDKELDIATDGETDTKETANGEESKETADSSKDTEEVATYEVSDKGEVVTDDKKKEDTEDKEETSAPGEAVLVSTTTTPDFFASKLLEREQLRAKNQEQLTTIINNTNLSEASKEEAINKMISMTTIAEQENATETLLEAKGFSDALVTIRDNGVDVVINATSLTEQDVAKITDIVKRNTGAEAKDIVIAPVVATE